MRTFFFRQIFVTQVVELRSSLQCFTESSELCWFLSSVCLLFIAYWPEIFYGPSPDVGNTFRIMIHSRKTDGVDGYLSRSERRKCIER